MTTTLSSHTTKSMERCGAATPQIRLKRVLRGGQLKSCESDWKRLKFSLLRRVRSPTNPARQNKYTSAPCSHCGCSDDLTHELPTSPPFRRTKVVFPTAAPRVNCVFPHRRMLRFVNSHSTTRRSSESESEAWTTNVPSAPNSTTQTSREKVVEEGTKKQTLPLKWSHCSSFTCLRCQRSIL